MNTDHRLTHPNDGDPEGVEMMARMRAAEDRGEIHTCELNDDPDHPECWFCGREMG